MKDQQSRLERLNLFPVYWHISFGRPEFPEVLIIVEPEVAVHDDTLGDAGADKIPDIHPAATQGKSG